MADRPRAAVAKILFWQIVATGVLVLAVILLGVQTRESLQAGDAAARLRQTEQLRAACARGVARDFESWGTNRDLARFAADAAATRRATGDVRAARKYRARARAAAARMRSIAMRLPPSPDVAAVTVFCRRLFPEPTPDATSPSGT